MFLKEFCEKEQNYNLLARICSEQADLNLSLSVTLKTAGVFKQFREKAPDQNWEK